VKNVFRTSTLLIIAAVVVLATMAVAVATAKLEQEGRRRRSLRAVPRTRQRRSGGCTTTHRP